MTALPLDPTPADEIARLSALLAELGKEYKAVVDDRARLIRQIGDLKTALAVSAPYGFCPHCAAPGVARERSPDGLTHCSAGHRYLSRDAVTA